MRARTILRFDWPIRRNTGKEENVRVHNSTTTFIRQQPEGKNVGPYPAARAEKAVPLVPFDDVYGREGSLLFYQQQAHYFRGSNYYPLPPCMQGGPLLQPALLS